MDVRTLPTHPRTGLTALGYRRNGEPIWPVMGAADEPAGDDGADGSGEDDLDGDADLEGDDADSDAEPVVDWKARYDAQAAALEASDAKLRRARLQAKTLREQAAAANPAVPAAAAASPLAVPARRPAAAAQPAVPAEPQVVTVQDDSEVVRWQEKAIRADAKSALLARGCDPDLLDAPLSRLKVGDIDWDGDDPILDEYLDAMEERYPKLFAKPEPVAAPRVGAQRRPGSINQGAAAAGQPAQSQPSFGERLWASGGGAVSSRRRG